MIPNRKRLLRPALRIPSCFPLIVLALFSGAADAHPQHNLSAELVQVLHADFVSRLGLPGKDVMVEYASITKPVAELPAWDEMRVLPGKKPARTGLQMVRCGFFLHGKLQDEVAAKVRVRTFQNVVVCGELIGRHEVVSAREVKLERLETTRLAQNFYTAEDQVVGMRTRKVLRPGEMIKPAMIGPVPAVANGKHVKIHFNKGGVVLILPGVARQDGGIGDVIMVKCPENRKVYRGKIVNDETVVVDF